MDRLDGPEVSLAVAGSADDPEHQQDAIDAANRCFGCLDVLVNNTGINPAFGPMLDIDTGAMRNMIEVNVIAALSWVKKALVAGLDRTVRRWTMSHRWRACARHAPSGSAAQARPDSCS